MVKVRAAISCPDLDLNGVVVEIARVRAAAYSAGVDLVRITQVRGATVSYKGETLFAPSVPVDALDTLGAGDAFVSRLVYRVLTGVPLVEAANHAAHYAALIYGTRGAFGHARSITREIPW
jgi:fructoselysine 6-kinase